MRSAGNNSNSNNQISIAPYVSYRGGVVMMSLCCDVGPVVCGNGCENQCFFRIRCWFRYHKRSLLTSILSVYCVLVNRHLTAMAVPASLLLLACEEEDGRNRIISCGNAVALCFSVIFVNENENENYQKRKNNDSVNEN